MRAANLPAMSQTIENTTDTLRTRPEVPAFIRKGLQALKRRPEVPALILLAAVLNIWALDQNGWANEYYGAAVRSMSGSWHNFFYGSFDAAGVMTFDKPPLAIWVQALSVRIFGFSTWSILLPQALMGVASTVLVYDLTRRVFGRLSGTVAGLVFALTPITVAIFRHNNPDALLLLVSLAAVWFVVRGLEDGRTRWLVFAAVCVGLGFETKMGAALLVLPGLALAWFWVAPAGRGRAIVQLLIAGAVMLAVGLAWPLLMALTPADSRPWISGTSDNSIWSLITGYNGLGRLDGQAGGPGGGMPGGGGMGSVFGGSSGPLRLLEASLGGQIGWLLGFAAGGGILVAIASKLRRIDPRAGWIIAVGGALATAGIAFSFASGIFHPYYVSLLAPFAAALVGAGFGELLENDRLARYAAAPVLALAGVAEIIVIEDLDQGYGWLVPVLAVVMVAAAVVLIYRPGRRWRRAALAAVLVAMMVPSAAWSVQTLGHPTSSTFPAGGPDSQGMGGPGGPGGMGGPGGQGGPGDGMVPPAGMARPAGMTPPTGMTPGGGTGTFPGAPPAAGGMTGGPGGADLTSVIETIEKNGGGNLAISSQQSAGSSILDQAGTSDVDIVAIGGFSGRESEVSADWLSGRVASGEIRWVLATDPGGPGGSPADGRTGSDSVMSAVEAACSPVSGETDLYDCAGDAGALSASTS